MKKETIRNLPRWAQVAGVLTLTYLVFFELPGLWAISGWTWGNIRAGRFAGILAGLGQLVLTLTGIAIWASSVVLCGRALLFSGKKAYAFLLAFLLICTVTAPMRYITQQIAYANLQRQLREMPEGQKEQFAAHPPRRPTVVVAKINLAFPVGPALLFMAIWFMCKADGMPLKNKFLDRIG